MDNWYYKCRDGSYYLGATPRHWEKYKQRGSPFGRYVAQCNLKAIKCFGFKDKNLFDLE